jgi:hypothetical protein
MRSRITRVLTLLMVIAPLLLLAPAPVFADTECQVNDPQTGVCLVWVEVPGTPGTPGEEGDDVPVETGGGESCVWDGTALGITKPPPGPVPCSSDAGYWSNGLNCYIQLATPVPPAGDPAWQGHEPGDGAVYHCYQPQTGILVYLWSQDPPPDAGTTPTPGEVARLAIEDMQLKAINIGLAPEPGPDSVGLVGMPVWMWAAGPDDHTFGPITASASAGDITITATARVHRVTWDMGDGTEVVCHNAGTPYKPEYGMQQSPTCGYVYATASSREQDGKFTVTASSDWVVEWTGAGQSGVIRLNGLRRSVAIAVGEAQVLVQ